MLLMYVRVCTLSAVKLSRYLLATSAQIPGQKINPQLSFSGPLMLDGLTQRRGRAWNEVAWHQGGNPSALFPEGRADAGQLTKEPHGSSLPPPPPPEGEMSSPSCPSGQSRS